MNQGALAQLVDRYRAEDRTQAFYYTRVLSPNKCIWVANMKVASTTIAVTLAKLDGIKMEGWGDWDRDAVSKLRDFSTAEIVEMLSSPAWYRFCFVRNPYTRLLSAYKSKIGNANAEPFYQQAQNDIRDAFDYPMVGGKRSGTVNFRDFVAFVQSGQRLGDSHWCVQSTRLMADLVPYDFIGRYERFQSDFIHVLEHLKAPPDVLAMASEVRGKSPDISPTSPYDQELADRVYEIYAEDFEAFDYPRNSWMSSA